MLLESLRGTKEYWDERARRYGRLAVGNLDPNEYYWEEQLRWAAFNRLYPRPFGMRVLDIGCGVGTWAVRLSELGCEVVGVDVSPVMIEMAMASANVVYRVGTAQDLDFSTGTFDLIISVTVLQHIVDDKELSRALRSLWRVLKDGGCAAVLEYSPMRVNRPATGSDYMRYRTRQQWIAVFEEQGFRLASETGVRFFGHRLYPGALRRIKRLRPEWKLASEDGCPTHWIAGWLYMLTGAVNRGLARLPLSSRFADVHLFLFGKIGGVR